MQLPQLRLSLSLTAFLHSGIIHSFGVGSLKLEAATAALERRGDCDADTPSRQRERDDVSIVVISLIHSLFFEGRLFFPLLSLFISFLCSLNINK